MSPAAAPVLPRHLTSRPLEAGDAPVVVDLMAEAEVLDQGEVMVDINDIVGDWQRPSFDLATESVGVFEDGRLVGYAEVYKGRRAEVYVRPGSRGQGIGTALLRWTWEVSRARGGTLVGQTVPATLAGAVALFESHGYETLWTSWILELAPGAQISAPDLPASVSIRAFVPGADDHGAYRVIEDAFNEWPDRDPSTFEDWAASTTGRPGFDSRQFLLAEEAGELIGACYLTVYGDAAWVHQIAVRRSDRGRGLARALLLQAFDVATAGGAARCQLSTDSRTGALGLYEHVGMHVVSTYLHYAKAL